MLWIPAVKQDFFTARKVVKIMEKKSLFTEGKTVSILRTA